MDIQDYDIWKALYVDEFNHKKYLYHYTSADSATKILHTNSLLFGKISKTNDTTESKVRISFDPPSTADKNYQKKCDSISNYLTSNKDIFQLMCLSTDTKLTPAERRKYLLKITSNDKYYDVSGRGFALPRMWAQYAHNHEGVCFVLNREKLIQMIKDNFSFYRADYVKYSNICDRYHFDNQKINSLYQKISTSTNGNLPLLSQVNDNDFLLYNFYNKSSDWENEHEYRVIIYVDPTNAERVKIPKITDAIEGIVIGERMDLTTQDIIRSLFKNNLKRKLGSTKNIDDVFKQIIFTDQICKLK